ncbi:MAG: S-layer homology domain-containing protein [Oscillospiraceae bacterium]|nr:S-layer homology domain-containing protein [Oscillospiraceae bacterium]
MLDIKKMIAVVLIALLLPGALFAPVANALTWEEARSGILPEPSEAGDEEPEPDRLAAFRAAVFTDVMPSEWYFQYIEELASKGLARGNPDGTYAPDAPLLVDEFLAFTLRTLGSDLPNADGYWALNYIKSALALGLIDAGAFDDYSVPVTREQIADIVVRASGESFPHFESFRGIFSDVDASTKPTSILKAIELGVLAGYEDKTFRPKNTATRAEASVIVLRMIDPTYRLELYDDIFYNAKTDLDENGNMKKDKAKDFMMKFIADIHIGVSENGNAVLNGVIPALPDGQNFFYDVSIFDEEGTYLSYHTTAARFEEQYIPPRGRHKIETKATIKDIGNVMITMSIAKGSLPSNLQEPISQIVIYKYFYEVDFRSEGFLMHVDGESLITRFDFNLIEGIWGW